MKKTEVGLIPDDWEVKTLGDLFVMKAGGDVDKKHFSSFKNTIFKYKIFSNGLENEGIYGYTDFPKYKGNAITITGRGTVGVSMYRKEDFDAVIRLLVLNSKHEKTTDNFFISELINSFVKFPNESTGVPQLTVPQIKNIQIPLPSFKEQQRIAKALSDVDAVISTIELLIQKKKNIKQGTMQQLLTGKKRLPGFATTSKFKQTELGEIPEDWEVIQVNGNYFLKGRIGWQGLKASEFIDKGPYLVTGTDFENGKVNWNTCYHISEKRYEEDKALHVQNDDLLITKDGTVGKVAYIDKKPEKVSLNSHLLIIRPLKKNLINRFLYYILNSKYFFDYYQQTQTGTTMASLSQEKISKFMYPLPSKEEQTAIANVLSSMDKEIETLTTKLEKYRNLKTAMMQQLLTGKIRLSTSKTAETEKQNKATEKVTEKATEKGEK